MSSWWTHYLLDNDCFHWSLLHASFEYTIIFFNFNCIYKLLLKILKRITRWQHLCTLLRECKLLYICLTWVLRCIAIFVVMAVIAKKKHTYTHKSHKRKCITMWVSKCVIKFFLLYMFNCCCDAFVIRSEWNYYKI